jgi:hypothetical protein
MVKHYYVEYDGEVSSIHARMCPDSCDSPYCWPSVIGAKGQAVFFLKRRARAFLNAARRISLIQEKDVKTRGGR